jgi:hypothetical protein
MKVHDALKWMALLAFAALATGCVSIRTEYLADDVAKVNKLAFDNKVRCDVRYCDRWNAPYCWQHHGAYIIGTTSIHIAPEWYWEPRIYHVGVIAHEMIHAYLDQSGQEHSEKECHSWLFRKERDRVAKALDIPVWAIPDGRREDKIDASRQMAWLSAHFDNFRNSTRGLSGGHDMSTAGWPKQDYDPDDE